LTGDGVEIVVRTGTARAVATAAIGAVGSMTIADVDELRIQSFATRSSTLAVVALAEWIARALKMDAEMVLRAGELAGKKGVARG
jgi:hypothetical protein